MIQQYYLNHDHFKADASNQCIGNTVDEINQCMAYFLSKEEDQKHNNTRKMYQKVNQFKKRYQHKFIIIRNKKGELAMNTKGRAEIWKEYFDKLLNTEEPRELIKKGNKEIGEVEVEELTIGNKELKK